MLAKARVQSKLSLTLCHNWMQLMGAGLQLKSSWEQDDTQTVQIAAKSTSKRCRNALDECLLPLTGQCRRSSHHLYTHPHKSIIQMESEYDFCDCGFIYMNNFISSPVSVAFSGRMQWYV